MTTIAAPEETTITVRAWWCLRHERTAERPNRDCLGRTVYQDWPEQNSDRLPCSLVQLGYHRASEAHQPEPETDIEARREASLAEHPYPYTEALT